MKKSGSPEKSRLPLSKYMQHEMQVGHKSVLTTMQNYSYDTLDALENRRILNSGLNIITVQNPEVNKSKQIV